MKRLTKNSISSALIEHQDEIQGFGANHLALFGSFAKHEHTPSSDVDLLVDFDPSKGLFIFLELKSFLEKLLGCEIDLVSRRALHPALRDQILDEAKDVF